MQKEKEILEPEIKLEPEILYEDENILAVNKPAGLMVHPDGKSKEKTLSDWILDKYPETKDVGEPLVLQNGEKIPRPGIVHRIDRWTSGVLLVAKSQKAYEHLKKQFQGRIVKKIYYCFVYGLPKDKFGTINKPLGRSKGDFRQYTSPERSRGEMREAITYYEVEKSSPKASLLKVMPKTGRTHQIRAHLKSIGHPIIADKLYAPKGEDLLGFNRLALHAFSVTFFNLNGQEKVVEAPLPKDFNEALKVL